MLRAGRAGAISRASTSVRSFRCPRGRHSIGAIGRRYAEGNDDERRSLGTARRTVRRGGAPADAGARWRRHSRNSCARDARRDGAAARRDHRDGRIHSGDPVTEQLQSKFGLETTLHPDQLKCLLLVVTRNVTTDSPWPTSSSPVSKDNNRRRRGRGGKTAMSVLVARACLEAASAADARAAVRRAVLASDASGSAGDVLRALDA